MKPLISALEPRLLFDGAAITTAVEVLDNNSFEKNTDTTDIAVTTEPLSNNKKEITFIDSDVKDYQSIIDELDPNIEVYILDNNSNGLDQIASILEGKNNIDAIHILSHGDVGEIKIGNSSITSDNISLFADKLGSIGNSLSVDGDILLYGCSISANGEGKDFVDNLAVLTQADVSASDDITGDNSLGGDWELEYKTGNIEAVVIASESYTETLANSAPILDTTPVISDITTGLPSSAYTDLTGVSNPSEEPQFAFDDDTSTNYVNTWTTNGSFIIDTGELYTVTSITFTTASDSPLSDPDSYILLGSNDNSNFTQINALSITLPATRLTDFTSSFANVISYRYYKLILNNNDNFSSPGGTEVKIADISLSGTSIANVDYTENASPVNALDHLGLTDSDNANLISATVSITGGHETSDVLTFVNDNAALYGSISSSFDAMTGVLTLSGSSTVQQYENALKAVTYHSTSDNPTINNSTRNLSWQVNDGTDNSNTDTSTITITSVNDVPDIQIVDVSGNINEGSVVTDNGSITFTDADMNDTPFAIEVTKSINALEQDGTTPLVLSAAQKANIEAAFSIENVIGNTNNGTVNWDYTITESQLNFLGEGEVVTAVFTITVTDDSGATDTQDITITITGSDDSPDIQVVKANGTILEGTTLSDGGSITFTDLDATDRPVATQVTKTVSALSQDGVTPLILSSAQKADIEAAFSILNAGGNTNNGTVTWDYSILNSKLDFLGEGEVVTAVFTITVTSDEGVTDTQDVTITITGINDSPNIQVVDVTGNITEGSTLSDNGSLTFTDLDLSDRPTGIEVTKSVNALDQDGVTPLILSSAQKADIEAAFSILNAGGNTNDGTITWDYTLSESQLDFLGEGEVVTAVFTVTVTDDEGVSVSQDITITITGTNDSHNVQVIDVIGSITEGSALSDNGSITFTDVDLTDRPTASEVTKSIIALQQDGITPLVLTTGQKASIEAAFTISNVGTNTNDGTVTWDYTIVESQLDFLGSGEVLTAVFTITVTSDEGISSTQDVTITITGTNDNPNIQVVDVIGNITEGSALSDNGSITFTDVNLTDRPIATESTKSISALLKDGVTPLTLTAGQISDIENSFSILNVGGNTNDGTVTWDYTISESQLDYLAQGEVITAVFTITVTDDEGATSTQDVTVTITGTNDIPTVSSVNIDVELAFGEAYTKDISTLFDDVDGTDVLTYEVNGLPSGLSYDSITGIITGKGKEVGLFIIEIKAYDSASPSASISRTYDLLVLAPPELDIPVFEEAEKIIVPVQTEPVDIIDFESDEVEGVLNLSDEQKDLTNVGEGFILNEDIKKTTAPPSFTSDVIKSISLTFQGNHESYFSENTSESFDVLGLSIENMAITGRYIEMKLIDVKVAQRHEVTLLDGSPLPKEITFDEETGIIKGEIKEDIEITIKAINLDGSVRVMNLKINMPEITEAIEIISTDPFIGLQEQIKEETQRMQEYGEHLNSLFRDE